MIREIVFGVGFALLLPQIVIGATKMNPEPHQLGLDGVLWSMPASDLLTGIISAFVVVYTFKQLKK